MVDEPLDDPDAGGAPAPEGRAGSVTPCCLRQAASLARWAGSRKEPRPELEPELEPELALATAVPLLVEVVLLLPQAATATVATTAPRANPPRRIRFTLVVVTSILSMRTCDRRSTAA